jgi:Mrp family chromosome partitioning ATPase
MFPDARVLGQMCDGAIMVVRSESTEQGNALAAGRYLAEMGIRLFGVILNDYRSQAATYGGKYGYHYYPRS